MPLLTVSFPFTDLLHVSDITQRLTVDISDIPLQIYMDRILQTIMMS
jgi:hypothetical protein